ncbi:MAG TPA: MBL fold metallo-hydrolase, partial [Actinomycetes bacterium]|nr:MBL fold metallo-hydrolase [Actinomycetes bacterium]
MPDFDPAHVDRGGPPYRYPCGPLEVTKLHVGPYENNAYLLRDPETNDALLVDAANEAERLVELLEGVALVGIVTTHRHLDHISALAGVLKVHDVWNGAHPADADAIADQVGVTPDRVLEHGDTLTVGRHAVTVLHTPGHTEGSISFKLPSSQVLTGDALFPGGVGRTEGPDAFAEAIRSAER